MRRLPLFFFILLLAACKQQQLKSFNNVVDSNDTIAMMIDSSRQFNYYSPKLGFTVSYPSFLMHQSIDTIDRLEVFIYNDVSLTVRCDSVDNMGYSPGQQLMGMGAELLTATDRYSILAGSDEGLDYYAKVIDDSLRVVTLTLRYSPDHEYVVQRLKQWIDDYDPLVAEP